MKCFLGKIYNHSIFLINIKLSKINSHPPFYDTDPMGIYQKIVKSIINFPDFFSLRVKDLIRKLLNPSIVNRLGCADVILSIDIFLYDIY